MKLLESIDLPGHMAEGGFDHAALHAGSSRLYVAHTCNDSVDVIDCAADRFLFSIPNLIGVAGILVSEESGQVFTSNRREDSIGFFKVGDEKSVARIKVGVHPNGLAFDPRHGVLLAANVGSPDLAGSFTVSIVDIAREKLIAIIPAPGRTRWAVFDARTDAFYVNIADPAQIIVLESARPDRISRTMDIPATGPHGLDLDPDRGFLFCACDSGKILTISLTSGDILAEADLSGAPDVIFFNRELNHLYTAIGDPGVIDVFETTHLRKLETVPTGRGAHTLAFDRVRSKVYAFLPQTHQADVFMDDG